MKPAQVSIIIPTFNRVAELAQTLDSVLGQTFTDWECLVIDDGSTDQTPEMMQQYTQRDPRFSYHKRPADRPKGANACRNFGLKLSRGNYINWTDSDDLMLPDHLQGHFKAHEAAPDCGATVSNAKVFIGDAGNTVRDWSDIHPKKDLIGEMIATRVMWQTACVVWKKSALPARPFKEDLASSQEWTFHLMQLICGVRYEILNETTFLIREHAQRIGKSPSVAKFFSMFRSRQYIYELLRAKKILSRAYERDLLHYVLFALRVSIQLKYYRNALVVAGFLMRNFFRMHHKRKILFIFLIALPVYVITGKGERLFKI